MKAHLLSLLLVLGCSQAAFTQMFNWTEPGQYMLTNFNSHRTMTFHLPAGFHIAIVPNAKPPEGWDAHKPWPPAEADAMELGIQGEQPFDAPADLKKKATDIARDAVKRVNGPR